MKFFMMMLPAFLARVNPDSTRANPACMNMTSMPAMTTHTSSSAAATSAMSVWALAAKASGPSSATAAITVTSIKRFTIGSSC